MYEAGIEVRVVEGGTGVSGQELRAHRKQNLRDVVCRRNATIVALVGLVRTFGSILELATKVSGLWYAIGIASCARVVVRPSYIRGLGRPPGEFAPDPWASLRRQLQILGNYL
jgi:hypothetical protein